MIEFQWWRWKWVGYDQHGNSHDISWLDAWREWRYLRGKS